MLSRCGFDAASLLSMSICPALSSYREIIGVPESVDGLFDPKEFTIYFPGSIIPSSSVADSFVQQSSVSDTYTLNDNFDYGDDDDDDNDNEIGDFGDLSDYPPPIISSARKSVAGIAFNRRSSIGGVGKIQWDTASESNTVDAVHDPATPKGKESLGSNGSGSSNSVVWDAAGITCSNEYSFFDMDLVNKSNSWAGARHWKYATRRQTQIQSPVTEIPISNEGDEDRAVLSDSKKISVIGNSIKGPKEKFKFDFLSPFPSQELFAVSKSRSKGSDVTCLTAAALEKEALIQKEGGLFLPPDAKLQTSDLCRLMLSHTIIVPPPMLAHVFMRQAASSSSRKGKNGDVIWGHIRRVTQANGVFQFQPNIEYDDGDDDDNDGGNFGEDFCDPELDDVVILNREENENDVSDVQRDGLYISTEGLLRATRTVDKIDIGYVHHHQYCLSILYY